MLKKATCLSLTEPPPPSRSHAPDRTQRNLQTQLSPLRSTCPSCSDPQPRRLLTTTTRRHGRRANQYYQRFLGVGRDIWHHLVVKDPKKENHLLKWSVHLWEGGTSAFVRSSTRKGSKTLHVLKCFCGLKNVKLKAVCKMEAGQFTLTRLR